MLSEEEKKAINYLEKEYKKLKEEGNILFPLYKQQAKTLLNLITKLQKENEEKDKQIDLMAEKLVQAHEWFYSEFDNFTKEDFIEYFERKVEKC